MDWYEKLPLMVKFSDILETIEILQFQYDKQHNGVNFSIMLVFETVSYGNHQSIIVYFAQQSKSKHCDFDSYVGQLRL